MTLPLRDPATGDAHMERRHQLVPERVHFVTRRPELFRIPRFDPARRPRVASEFCWGRPIQLGDEWRGCPRYEALDAVSSRDERACQIGQWRLADDDDESHAVANDRAELVRLLTDARVMRERAPAALRHCGQPFFVRSIRAKVITMPLGGDSGFVQEIREDVAEVAISKEDNAQAARSYSTACSMSAAGSP